MTALKLRRLRPIVMALVVAVIPSPAGADTALRFEERLEELDLLFSEGKFDEADGKALELFREIPGHLGERSAEEAQVLDRLVRIRYRNGGRREVVTLAWARRSREIWESIAPGSDEHAGSLYWLGAVVESLGRLDEAEEHHQRALEIRQTLHGDRHLSVADSLDSLAGIFLEQAGDDDALRSLAEELLLQALATREDLLGPESLLVAESCNSLVRLYFRLGDFETGRTYSQRSLSIREQLLEPDHPLVGKSWHNLAVMDYELGRFGAARTEYEKALELRTAALGPDHPEVGSTHSALGSLLRDTGDFAEAEEHYRAALGPMASGYGEDHPRYATLLSNIALLLEFRGDYEPARDLQRRSAQIRRGEDREGETLAWLGRLEWKLGNSAEAQRLLKRGLVLQERRQGQDHPNLVDTLAALAEVQLSEGRVGKAEDLYTRAASILAEFERGHPSLAEIYVRLSEIQNIRGRTGDAMELAGRAQEILGPHFGPGHPLQADALLQTARARLADDDLESALKDALEAHRISRDHLQSTMRHLPERAALAYLGSLDSGLDLALSILAEDPSTPGVTSAWEVLMESRVSVLDELASRSRAAHLTSEAGSAEIRQRLTEARRRLTNLTVGSHAGISPETRARQIRQAGRQAEAAEAELARFVASLPQPSDSRDLAPSTIHRHLAGDEALIAFVFFEREQRPKRGRASGIWRRGQGTYGAFVLPPGGADPTFRVLAVRASLDAAIGGLGESARRALAGSAEEEEAYRQTAESLRRSLWDPLAPHISEARTVFVVPDGDLALMSFPALPAGEGRYLIETGPTLHVLTAERDLLREETPRRGEGILLVGGVNFDARQLASGAQSPRGPKDDSMDPQPRKVLRSARSACLDDDWPFFEPLPETFPEVSEILRRWATEWSKDRGQGKAPPVTLLSGTAAKEGEFKRLAPGRRILHVSTHGFFFDGDCSKDLIGAEGQRTRQVLGNPLATSGLAFAGANSRQVTSSDTEDGILTAEEVATLDLQGVSWVVLSACETAQGRASAGEGVTGLRRAFRIAGAETIVMSLWPVDDVLARQWMTALYDSRLKDGSSTAEAVRSASLSTLEGLRRQGSSTHPAFWANFIASGRWQ